MRDLAAIVKSVAGDAASAGEKAGQAFIRHLTGIGTGLKDSAETYRRAEDDIKASIGKIGLDGEHGIAGDTGALSRGTAGTADPLRANPEVPGSGEDPVGREAADGRVSGDGGAGGDPVDVVTGEMFLPQRDLYLPGILPLVLERRFSSGYTHGGCFGRRWSSTLDQRVQPGPGGIRFTTADGRVLHYPVPAGQEEVFASFGPRWPLTWDRSAGRDEIRIEQGEHGRTLSFLPGTDGGGPRPLASVTDRGGNRYDFDYSDSGIPAGIRHSGGYHVRLGSGVTVGGERITSVRLADPAGGEDLPVAGFRYDLAGNLTGIYDPDSPAPLEFKYDSDGRITSWTDRNGHWYRYEYRPDGRVAAAHGEDGYLSTVFSYDLDARVTTVTDALGHDSVHHWNDLGQTWKVTDPLGGERFTEQDQHGEVLSNTDQLGRTATVERNAAGDPVRVTGPDGEGTVIDYDDRRLPVRAAHSDGRAWTYEHGPHGQVTSIANPLGAVIRYDYTEQGVPRSVTDPAGATTVYRCDAAGQPTGVIDAAGTVTVLRRDAFGRVTEAVDSAGASTVFEWSPGGRLRGIRYPDGAAERWEHDPEGNVSRITGPNGTSVTFAYGAFDKLTERTDPDGSVYRFTYDAMLRLTTVTGPTGLTWDYEHDAAGRLIAETDFDGVRVEYGLDAAGQLSSRTTPAGTVSFTRDAAGRLTEREAGGSVTRFSYGIAGQMARAESPGSVIEIAVDALGQAVSETVNGRTMTSAYDLAGRRTERVTPGGTVTRWAYDAAGRPAAMTGTSGSLTFSYDQAGRQSGRVVGPGAAIQSTYDLAGRPATEEIWRYPNRDALDPAPGSSPVRVQARAYEYLPDGTPAEIRDALRGTRRFDVDAAGRVTGVQAGTWQASYAYDALGNLAGTSDPAAPEDTDGDREYRGTKIRRAGRTVYEHDAAGRLIRRTRRTLSGQSRTWHFGWDAEGRLVSASLPGGDTWRYLYDAFGRRISKTRHGPDGTARETVRFHWDGPRLAEETVAGPDGETTLTWDYEPDGFTPLAQTRRHRAADAPQDEIDARFHAIVTDLVGAPAELVTPDGAVEWHTTTSLWGKTVTAPGSTADCPLRFPGQFHDQETGLDYNLARYYDPDLGAYLSSDPLGLAPGANNTAYVANPLTEYDPFGLFSCNTSVQGELADFRRQTNMKSVAGEDALAKSYEDAGKGVPNGTLNTVGKMEFDQGRDPIFGKNGKLPDRTAAYPGKGNQMSATSFQDHAEGDMVHQAGQKGYTGGNASIYTDRNTCPWCRNSMHGYVKRLGLDSLEVHDPEGHVGTWYKGGTFTKGPAWHW